MNAIVAVNIAKSLSAIAKMTVTNAGQPILSVKIATITVANIILTDNVI